MIKDPNFESLTNVGTTGIGIASEYAGIGNVWGSYLYENPYPMHEQPHNALRYARASEAITRFLQAISSEHDFEEVVGRALGVFDGQLYLWLFTRNLNTELTRKLFALKYAVEQQLRGEFEIHVEPLGAGRAEDLMPSGYVAI